MKRLTPPRRVEPDDSVVQGMEAVFVLVLFLGLGFLLDRWLGSAPAFTIGMTLLGAVGLFLKFKHSYIARMERLEAERRPGSRSGSKTVA
jgi:F0F1-type ATP synthase assembly protein I